MKTKKHQFGPLNQGIAIILLGGIMLQSCSASISSDAMNGHFALLKIGIELFY
jgi:hypothetical protein